MRRVHCDYGTFIFSFDFHLFWGKRLFALCNGCSIPDMYISTYRLVPYKPLFMLLAPPLGSTFPGKKMKDELRHKGSASEKPAVGGGKEGAEGERSNPRWHKGEQMGTPSMESPSVVSKRVPPLTWVPSDYWDWTSSLSTRSYLFI